ncbi:hypothetical protein HAL_14300 [Haladaptatus sp. T7]|nr:hypothetical protein HAL_14300 [Haladaptatus sp. T7]
MAVDLFHTDYLARFYTFTPTSAAGRTSLRSVAANVEIAMPEVTTTSEAGYSAENEVRDFSVTIDATGEDAPDTLETLLAAYGSCYVPALRVGGEQRGAGDLGKIEIDVSGDLNDDDKLDAVAFDIKWEAETDDETAQDVIDRAFELCKVHDAVKESLHAETTVETGAF